MRRSKLLHSGCRDHESKIAVALDPKRSTLVRDDHGGAVDPISIADREVDRLIMYFATLD